MVTRAPMNPQVAQLVRAGLRTTAARVRVLAQLSRARRPLTVADIVRNLRGAANQATVYRTLQQFAERGLVRRVNFEHDHGHFELTDPRDHHHVICVRCGTVEDITDCVPPAYLRRIQAKAKQFARIERHALEFFGTCRSCAKRR